MSELSTSMSWKSVLRSSAMFPDLAQPLTWGSRGRCSTLSQVKLLLVYQWPFWSTARLSGFWIAFPWLVLSGVVQREKLPAFERLLFRATKGNCHLKFNDLLKPVIDPHTGESMDKAVFVVFFSGETVRTKITKICNAFGANLYPFPFSHNSQMTMYNECRARLNDLENVTITTRRQKVETLSEIAAKLPLWSEKVHQIFRKIGVDAATMASKTREQLPRIAGLLRKSCLPYAQFAEL
mmetsp:Transcript_38916/g.153903  ORF Transcript_38916/g.153903 Transcript_38916/m.153903 type:complete len:238 (-) Transcript_38916:2120-2833(-)